MDKTVTPAECTPQSLRALERYVDSRGPGEAVRDVVEIVHNALYNGLTVTVTVTDPLDAKRYTLTRDDVGKAVIHAFGQPWMVANFMGQVLPGDVGKRVYLVDNVLQVENDAQRDARVSS